jgi:hypothetical protein
MLVAVSGEHDHTEHIDKEAIQSLVKRVSNMTPEYISYYISRASEAAIELETSYESVETKANWE